MKMTPGEKKPITLKKKKATVLALDKLWSKLVKLKAVQTIPIPQEATSARSSSFSILHADFNRNMVTVKIAAGLDMNAAIQKNRRF